MLVAMTRKPARDGSRAKSAEAEALGRTPWLDDYGLCTVPAEELHRSRGEHSSLRGAEMLSVWQKVEVIPPYLPEKKIYGGT